MLAIGNNELGEKLGKTILCPHCQEKHPIKHGTDSKGNVSKLLSFYDCGENSYLAGIEGKSIMHNFKKGEL